MLAIDGVGVDWHQMAQEETKTNMGLLAVEKKTTEFALMASFSDSEVCDNKPCTKSACKKN